MLVLDSCWVSGGRVDFTQHLFIWQLNVSNMVQMMMMMMMLFTFTQLYSILQYLFVPWVLFFFLFSFSLYIQTEEIKNFVFLNRRFVLSSSFWIISCPTVKYIHHNNPKVPTRNISARHCGSCSVKAESLAYEGSLHIFCMSLTIGTNLTVLHKEWAHVIPSSGNNRSLKPLL